MKCNYKRVLIITLLVFILISIVGSALYLFVYDANKPRMYQPEMDKVFIQDEIERLETTFNSEFHDEVIIENSDFEGILLYNCSVSSVEEIKEYIQVFSKSEYNGRHISFKNDSYEMYIANARYMPIIKALGHNWLHYRGNLYQRYYGKEEAQGKPNYRNQYIFVIRKDNYRFIFNVFCKETDAEKALSTAVTHINECIKK